MTTHTDARLTTKQRELRNEISALLEWLQVVPDLSAIDPADRTERLAWAKRELIISTVLREYLLMDEHLNNEMCREFFPKGTYAALWRTKRFRAFNHHVLERLYLVQKLEFVRARIPLPKEFYKDILALNDLRNAVAHSFFPENRRVKPKWKSSHLRVLISSSLICNKPRNSFSYVFTGTGDTSAVRIRRMGSSIRVAWVGN
jgi:hypothetical protein